MEEKRGRGRPPKLPSTTVNLDDIFSDSAPSDAPPQPVKVTEHTERSEAKVSGSTIKFKGKVPDRSYQDAAGFDLVACASKEIYPNTVGTIPTGVFVQIPRGYVGLVKCRSGLGFNKQLEVFQGVIDSDYRGEIMVQVKNNGTLPRFVKQGDRFAQLVVVPFNGDAIAVDELEETDRGDKGFGSSGVK